MVNKTEFYALVRDEAQKKLGDSCQCEIGEVEKGGRILQALILVKETDGVSPVVYLDAFYGRFLEGTGVDAIVEEILASCPCSPPDWQEAATELKDYAAAAGRLVVRVMNSEKNREFLARTPHVRVSGLDLAGIFFVILHADGKQLAGITVTQQLLEHWGKTTEELLQDARKNMETSYALTVTDIGEILGKMMGESFFHLVEQESEYRPNLHVLFHKQTGMMGSGAFLVPKALREFADEQERNLIIFPSSIHELLLLPDDGSLQGREQLYHMVEGVNQRFVSEEEFLSDRVYYYDRRTKKITFY